MPSEINQTPQTKYVLYGSSYMRQKVDQWLLGNEGEEMGRIQFQSGKVEKILEMDSDDWLPKCVHILDTTEQYF